MLAGTVTGYAIQYDREPTPLPALSQPDLRASKVVPADARTTARSVSAHRWVKTDGDLRDLLVKKPKGAKADELRLGIDGWVSVDEYAREYKDPAWMLRSFAMNDLRRIASTSWREGDEVSVVISLVQFRDTKRPEALNMNEDQQRYMPGKEYAGNAGTVIPGSGNGRVWVYDEPHREAGYKPLYAARALAQRGDVFMEIHYWNNSRPISKKAVMALAKRQLERL